MNENKKEVKLCGYLIRPIAVGKTAIYAAGGHIPRTSRVVAVHEQTEDIVHFETNTTHYHLSLSPFPLAVANPFSVIPAACA